MAQIKGAGDTDMKDNPKVSSKGMTFHGNPHKPGAVSHPGAVAPLTGSRVAGHTVNGHQLPREVQVEKEYHLVTKVQPKKADTGALDRGSYGSKYPGDKV